MPIMDDGSSRTAPVKPRERRARQTRSTLLDAAVTVLRRVGFTATTMQLVIEEADVSRGAALHHFPTRIDLFVAVAQHASEGQNAWVRRRLAGLPPGIDLYMAITEATWEAMMQPLGLALIEIICSARSDPQLSEALIAVVNDFENAQFEGVWEIAQVIGVKDREAIARMVRLNRAAMRGLAIEMMFCGDKRQVDGALQLLSEYKRFLSGWLLTNPDKALFG
ncbi:MAG: hypothetical protein DI544_02620 [Sphingomonas taxi]|uniref:HTH tetR-type domain-containing protein n=1 Tax=Sphingomonas taxi TaxID=1549858 RepID=A0A2W5PBW6_9SPHN|nr:MAG: hypothetical protein DI544_02620 [Sphingomonas taxi]